MADYLEKTLLELLGDMGNSFSKFRRDLLTIFGAKVGQGVTT